MKKIKICFVASAAYPLIKGLPLSSIGGAELQQSIIAKRLVAEGMDVSFISFDYGQTDAEEIHGMKFYKTFRLDEGLRIFRFVYPRLFRYWRALSNANADIYYQRCAGMITGLTAFFCKTHGRKFIFAGGHDTDFIPGKEIINNPRDRILYHYGLRRADRVIVQSKTQKNLLKSNYGLDGVVVRNCMVSPKETNGIKKDVILWVSTLRSWKRPEIFLEIAKKLSAMRFVMIGGGASGEDALYKKIEKLAAQIDNVDFLGFVPFDKIDVYFERTLIFVNTSIQEGFPNTFLQSLSRGIPVATFFDPDDCINKHGIGIVAKSFDEMLEGISNAMDDRKALDDMAQRAKAYFMENHSVERILPEYIKLFEQCLSVK